MSPASPPEASREGRIPRASGELAVHVLDVMLAIGEVAERYQAFEIAGTAVVPEPLPEGWDRMAGQD